MWRLFNSGTDPVFGLRDALDLKFGTNIPSWLWYISQKGAYSQGNMTFLNK